MKTNTKKRRFKKRNILPLICILLYIIFLVQFFKLGLVPLSIAVFVVIAIFTMIFIDGFLLINVKNKVLRIIGTVLLSIFLIINLVGIYYLHHTNKFLDKFNNKMAIKTTYYVVTNKSSNLTKKDIKGDIYYYKSNSDFDKANEELEKKYKEIYFKKSDSINTIFQDLTNNKINLMFVEEKFYSAIIETNETLNEEDYKILDEITIETELKSKKKNSNSFNLYLWGSDFTDKYMDFNMIVTVNMDTNKILLTSIPRDYYIPVFGNENKQRDKLSFMGPYGPDTVIKSVAEYFNTDIDYYLYFNAKNVPTVIDTLGGVEYCSDEAYTTREINPTAKGNYTVSKKEIYIKKGCQTLNGIETISAVRERTKFQGGDSARQNHIRQVIVGLIKKLQNPSTIANYSNILSSFTNLYRTTLPRTVVNEMAQTTINNGGNWQILEQSVNGQDGKDKVFLSDTIDWVKYPEEEEVKNASKAINELLK